MFQIYYSKNYGIYYIEYVGKGKEEELPLLIAKYERGNLTINAETTTISGEVKSLELMYQGEKVPTTNTEKGKLNYVVTEPGWYIVKSTNSKGKVRYAWLKATNLTGNLDSPNIDVTSRNIRK